MGVIVTTCGAGGIGAIACDCVVTDIELPVDGVVAVTAPAAPDEAAGDDGDGDPDAVGAVLCESPVGMSAGRDDVDEDVGLEPGDGAEVVPPRLPPPPADGFAPVPAVCAYAHGSETNVANANVVATAADDVITDASETTRASPGDPRDMRARLYQVSAAEFFEKRLHLTPQLAEL
jgi:hypothetical protein